MCFCFDFNLSEEMHSQLFKITVFIDYIKVFDMKESIGLYG